MQCCFVELHKHSVVDLKKSEQLQDFTGLWVKAIDTENPSVTSIKYVHQIAYNFLPERKKDHKGSLNVTNPLIRMTNANLGSAGT